MLRNPDSRRSFDARVVAGVLFALSTSIVPPARAQTPWPGNVKHVQSICSLAESGRREGTTLGTRAAMPDCASGDSFQCSYLIGALEGVGEDRGILSQFSFQHAMVYNVQFHDECANHDRCYRFGWKTYGLSKETCDNAFYDGMMENCENNIPEDIITFGLSGGEPCPLAAFEYYEGVKYLGDPSFKKDNGTCCPYRYRVELDTAASRQTIFPRFRLVQIEPTTPICLETPATLFAAWQLRTNLTANITASSLLNF